MNLTVLHAHYAQATPTAFSLFLNYPHLIYSNEDYSSPRSPHGYWSHRCANFVKICDADLCTFLCVCYTPKKKKKEEKENK